MLLESLHVLVSPSFNVQSWNSFPLYIFTNKKNTFTTVQQAMRVSRPESIRPYSRKKKQKNKTLSLIKQTYPITAFHLRARVIKKRLSHRSKSGVPTWGNPLSRSLPSSRALKVTQGALRSLTLTHQPRGSDWWSEELSLVFLSQSRPSSSVERVASDHCVCLDLNVCVWLTSWSAFLVLSWSFSAEIPRFIF